MTKRILIVDDNLSQREALQDIYEAEGYNVVTAANRDEALKLVREGKFDTALLDWDLGRGETTAEVIQAIPDNTEIIINSGTDDSTGRLERIIQGKPNVRNLEGKIGFDISINELFNHKGER